MMYLLSEMSKNCLCIILSRVIDLNNFDLIPLRFFELGPFHESFRTYLCLEMTGILISKNQSCHIVYLNQFYAAIIHFIAQWTNVIMIKQNVFQLVLKFTPKLGHLKILMSALNLQYHCITFLATISEGLQIKNDVNAVQIHFTKAPH